MSGPYKNVTMHDFKTNFSRYLVALQDRAYKAIVIYRYNRKLAMCFLLPSELEENAKKAEAVFAAYQQARRRHKEERRLIRARLMGHPFNEYPGWWRYDDSQL